MWTILFKVFIKFVTVLLLAYVSVCWSCGMWDPSYLTKDGTQHAPELEGEVLTPGPSGKVLLYFFN